MKAGSEAQDQAATPQLAGVHTCWYKTGWQGKAAYCKWFKANAIFDDDEKICQECFGQVARMGLDSAQVITTKDEDSGLQCFDYTDFNAHHTLLRMLLLNLTWAGKKYKISAAELLAIIDWLPVLRFRDEWMYQPPSHTLKRNMFTFQTFRAAHWTVISSG